MKLKLQPHHSKIVSRGWAIVVAITVIGGVIASERALFPCTPSLISEYDLNRMKADNNRLINKNIALDKNLKDLSERYLNDIEKQSAKIMELNSIISDLQQANSHHQYEIKVLKKALDLKDEYHRKQINSLRMGSSSTEVLN